MRITLRDNNGGGFSDEVDVQDGTTLGNLFSSRHPGKVASNYVFRVNRGEVSSDYTLRLGDQVSITPLKIDAAA